MIENSEIEKKTFIDKLNESFFLMGGLSKLAKNTFIGCISRPIYLSKVSDQIVNFGIGSLSITIIIGLVMGLVMTINFGYGLAKFGGTLYVPAMVNLSIFREMSPVFTSLIISGRIGSGMAAEIGSMQVTQQIDALRALGTNPIRILVVPRMIAAIICLPLLTALSDLMGMIGGLIVSMNEFKMTPGFYFNKVFLAVRFDDFFSGLLKSIVFAVIVTIISCYKGLNTKDGTRGVGESTTWVVVVSSLFILISDFFLSKLVLLFWIKE